MRRALACLLGLLWVVPAVSLSPSGESEYRLKAAFIVQFTKFVEWPLGSFEGNSKPLVIGVLNTDPFDGALTAAVSGEIVSGRHLMVKRVRSASELRQCHVVFVPRDETQAGLAMLRVLKGRSILSIGEQQGFAHKGGVVSFFIEQRKMRFEINLEAAKSAQLTISSKLLALAKIVGEGEAK